MQVNFAEFYFKSSSLPTFRRVFNKLSRGLVEFFAVNTCSAYVVLGVVSKLGTIQMKLKVSAPLNYLIITKC